MLPNLGAVPRALLQQTEIEISNAKLVIFDPQYIYSKVQHKIYQNVPGKQSAIFFCHIQFSDLLIKFCDDDQ